MSLLYVCVWNIYCIRKIETGFGMIMVYMYGGSVPSVASVTNDKLI